MKMPRIRSLIPFALLLVAVFAAGIGVAGVSFPPAPRDEVAPAVDKLEAAASTDAVSMSDAEIAASEIGVVPATTVDLTSNILASGTVASTPGAEAVLTTRAAGTIVRVGKRIGDPVRKGEVIALVESRDAAAIAAERSAADARVELARRQLERETRLLQQGVSPRADYETAEANLGVAVAEARRAAAAERVAGVASDGRSAAVVSPIDGRITRAFGNLGAYVQADVELFRVVDARRLQIEASLPPADAARIQAGDPVEVSAASSPTLQGRVVTSTGAVDPATRQATVVILPADGASAIVPGQLVRVRILARGNDGSPTITVSQDSVQTLRGRSVVFARTRQGFEARNVQLGRRSAGMVEILAGIEPGTPIASANAFLLKAELAKETSQ